MCDPFISNSILLSDQGQGSSKVQFQRGPGEIPSVRSDLKNPYSWCEVLTDP